MSAEHDYEHLLDTRGLSCPEPVMMLHGAVRDAGAGERIKILASDPSTERDIPKFCQFLGHELVSAGKEDEVFVYYVKKA